MGRPGARHRPATCSVIHLARDKWLSNARLARSRFMLRVKMQHYSCDFAPVTTYRIRVEQAQIRDDVLFVVDGQYGIGGCTIGEHRDQAAAPSSLQRVVDRSTYVVLLCVF